MSDIQDVPIQDVLSQDKKALFEAIDFPDGFDTPEVQIAILDWVNYKKARREAYKSPSLQITKLLKRKDGDGQPAFPTPEALADAES